MRQLMRVIALWGVLDSLWLARDPEAWGNFWERGVKRISHGRAVPRIVACLQLAICIWFLLQTRERKAG